MESQAIMTNDVENVSKDKKVMLVSFHLYIMLCKNLLAATNSFVHTYNGIINMVIMGLISAGYIWWLLTERKLRIPSTALIISYVLFIYFLISWVVKPDLLSNRGVREQIVTFFAYCFPLFLITSLISNSEELFESLAKYVYIPLVISIIGFAFSIQSQTSVISYNMSFGNNVLFINCIYLTKYKLYHEKKSLLAFLLTLLFIIVSGSRGPLVYIAVSLLVILLSRRITPKRVLLYLFLISIFAIIIMNFDSLLNWGISSLQRFGIYSRTLNMLQERRITADSGRNEIHRQLISLINRSPIWGLGAFGGAYYVYLSHSIFLDVFACFGYVGGAVILIFIFYRLLITLKRNRNTLTAELVLLLAVLAFAGGFFSGSFFGKKELWMLIGILIADANKQSSLY